MTTVTNTKTTSTELKLSKAQVLEIIRTLYPGLPKEAPNNFRMVDLYVPEPDYNRYANGYAPRLQELPNIYLQWYAQENDREIYVDHEPVQPL